MAKDDRTMTEAHFAFKLKKLMCETGSGSAVAPTDCSATAAAAAFNQTSPHVPLVFPPTFLCHTAHMVSVKSMLESRSHGNGPTTLGLSVTMTARLSTHSTGSAGDFTNGHILSHQVLSSSADAPLPEVEPKAVSPCVCCRPQVFWRAVCVWSLTRRRVTARKLCGFPGCP